jgi:hypothetical protein
LVGRRLVDIAAVRAGFRCATLTHQNLDGSNVILMGRSTPMRMQVPLELSCEIIMAAPCKEK